MDERTSELDLSVELAEQSPAALPALPEITAEFEALAPARLKKKVITTMTLTADTCKWPFGDPVSPDFHYCGRLPQSGRPYCSTHEAISRHASLRRKSA